MLTQIDAHDGKVIQKVVTPKGKVLGYQAGTPGDASSIQRFARLDEARKAIGKVINHPEKVTKAKAENPQNQPGYRAPTR